MGKRRCRIRRRLPEMRCTHDFQERIGVDRADGMQWQKRFFARQPAMGRGLDDADRSSDPFGFLRQKMQREYWSWWAHRLLHLLPGRRGEGKWKMGNAGEEIVEQ